MMRPACRTASACVAAAAMLAGSLPAAAWAQTQDFPPDHPLTQPPPPPAREFSDQPPPPNAPPNGQFAPPPPNSGMTYDAAASAADQAQAQQFSEWAAENCVQRRNNNVAAGAVIGGLLGAGLGAGLAGRRSRGTGAAIGGAVGAGTGAATAASRGPDACPPGYVVRAGAPPFIYAPPPAYPGDYYAGPGWYHPWVWEGGRWVYYPYRSWYWSHRGYWRR